MTRGVLVTLALVLGFSLAAAQQPDWQPADQGGGDEAERLLAEEIDQLGEQEQQRYSAVAKQLVEAINARDAKAYRALFNDEGWNSSIDWWRDMFAVQVERFGRISRAFAPQRGFVKVGGLGFRGAEGANGATFLVHFEEPCGGALTIVLDEAGKIAATDVFIKPELGLKEPEDAVVLWELAE